MTTMWRRSCWVGGLAIALGLGDAVAGQVRGAPKAIASVPSHVQRTAAAAVQPEMLARRYASWKQARADAAPRVHIPLGWSRGLSTEKTAAAGSVTIDLIDGMTRVELIGLEPGQRMDVWLVDNRPGAGRTVRVENGDRWILLATVAGSNDGTPVESESRPDPGLLRQFVLDTIVVTRAGRTPDQGGLLFGFPDLFQRLLSRELTTASAPEGAAATAIRMRLPQSDPEGGIGTLIEQCAIDGEQTFFNETFDGNGRTCGTCHPSANNFTLDSAFIAQLPPTDKLFVAEFDPNLTYPNAFDKRFEIPELMRSDGLILENIDGFPPLDAQVPDRFVLRGVPHVLGLSVSIGQAIDSLPGVENPLGWGGDGSPVGSIGPFNAQGSLEDFAIGAVRQHFTKRLHREPGTDFRFPTSDELVDLACFQLSLGRDADPDLEGLTFSNGAAESGKATFAASQCNNCHHNAGANVIGDNRNFRTGTELLLQTDILLANDGVPDPLRPADGGFGTSPCVINSIFVQANTDHCAEFPPLLRCVGGTNYCKTCASDTDCPGGGTCSAALAQNSGAFCTLTPPKRVCVHVDPDGLGALQPNCVSTLDGSFGDLSFNTPSLVESADTGPFFHNHLVDTLEEAIEFYGGAFFAAFNDGENIPEAANPEQRANIAAFLRALNAVDNLDHTVDPLIVRAKAAVGNSATFTPLATLAIGDIQDTINVLVQSNLNPLAVSRLQLAQNKLGQAIFQLDPVARLALVAQACTATQVGRNDVVDPNATLGCTAP